MAMHMIKSLNRMEKWLERKFFLFSSRSIEEQEEWESLWPQPAVCRDLLRQLLSLPKGKYHRFVLAFVLEAVVAATTGAAMVAIKKFWEPFESKTGRERWFSWWRF